MLLLQAMNF